MFIDAFLFYSTIFIIYCLPIVFIMIGLGAGAILIHSYVKNYALSSAIDIFVMCPVTILTGLLIIYNFWSASF